MTIIHNWEKYRDRRKSLRNGATLSEKILWKFLQKSQIGAKFKRQSGIDWYIVDFYCPEKKLVIELDGKYHDDPEVRAYDAEREAHIRGYGIRILRFKNEELEDDFDGVMQRISDALA